MATVIHVTKRDMVALESSGKPLAITVDTVDPKKVKDSTVLQVNMDRVHLGYGKVGDAGDAARRTIKRMGRQRRFYSKAQLAEAVSAKIGVPEGQSVKGVKSKITKAINSMISNGELLAVVS